ncbi:hypothetical protein F5144DRAFT_618120 [Chaetomium tenue]|uniref:Uncharacterized protein n=1 Tax=Chaetomium tenue TaxID=1854479 RepID=A0ACB7PHW7_9PEZI|nr:hypothetical protein F5144DRAFT_618120 [Chaetomium globosum]
MTYSPIPNFKLWGDNGNGSGSQTENALRDSDVLSPKESLAGFSPPVTSTLATSTAPITTGAYDAGDDWELVQPERSQIISKYFSAESNESRGWATLRLSMTPDPGARCYKKAPWVALLHVRTADMPRLMREGFFWSAENIVPEEGHVSTETSPLWASLGFCHKRTWVLADKSNDKVPRWFACLNISTPSFEILPRFQVQHLKPENAGGLGQGKKGWTVWVSDLHTYASVALNLARVRMAFLDPRNLNIFNILINSG